MVACSMVVAFDSHHVNESKRKKKKTRLNTLIESQKCRVETLFYYCPRSLNRSFYLLLFFPLTFRHRFLFFLRREGKFERI